MRFRPCIDIHNGKVKQIVGGSLTDAGDRASENFVSEKDAAWFSDFYHKDGLKGGHVILLNPASSPYYESTREQAEAALRANPGDFMLGGGVRAENAQSWLDAGASHVIVTSYVFSKGKIDREHLADIQSAVGKKALVLDLSCRKRGGRYWIVTERWQNFTDLALDEETLCGFMDECSEFLIHAADVEGKRQGPELELVSLLKRAQDMHGGAFPITYAGGIGSFEDLDALRKEGGGTIDLTVGSALDIFGGSMSYREVLTRTDHLGLA